MNTVQIVVFATLAAVVVLTLPLAYRGAREARRAQVAAPLLTPELTGFALHLADVHREDLVLVAIHDGISHSITFPNESFQALVDSDNKLNPFYELACYVADSELLRIEQENS